MNAIISPKHSKYDVVIVGAGIGGLVAGNYLAKAGMKVLILEKNKMPGGYCSSIRFNKFTFDISSLQGCGFENEFRKIINEIGIDKTLKIKRIDPSIIISSPDYSIKISNDKNKAVQAVCDIFPQVNDQVKDFFLFVQNVGLIELHSRWKKCSFLDLLKMFFVKDDKIMSFFSMIMSQSGVNISELSVISAIFYIRNLFFDGGYFIEGGLQKLSDSFSARFEEFGGEICFNAEVKKIHIDNEEVRGVSCGKDNFISSKYVISNCDAIGTFFDLIGKENLPCNTISSFMKILPSNSAFTILCVVNKDLKKCAENCQQLWDCPSCEDDIWDISRLEGENFNGHMYINFYSFQDESYAPKNCESISIGIYVPYIKRNYWSEKNSSILSKKILDRVEFILPGIKNAISKKIILTPNFFNRYSSNRSGALRGVAPFINQTDGNLMPLRTIFKNLFLASHWVSMPFGEAGLPMAAFTGKSTANLVVKKNRRMIK